MSIVQITPVVSEKSFALAEAGIYVFDVAPEVNKTQIKAAVEQNFEVKVIDVRTARRQGKVLRSRTRKTNTVGQRKLGKKAFVTLAKGQTIKMFEE